MHDPAAGVEGPGEVGLARMPHHLQVTRLQGFRLLVEGGPGKLGQAALPGCWQRMLGRDHFLALVP